MKIESKVSISLFCLGLLGVLAMMFFPLPIPLPDEVLEKISEDKLKIISFIQTSVLLALMVLLGHFSAKKVGLSAPFIQHFFQKENSYTIEWQSLRNGAIIGFIAGITMSFIANKWMQFLPTQFVEATKDITSPPLLRFLYGGITEEVITRWGLMSFFVWVMWTIFEKRTKNRPSAIIFWIGIILAAFLFGLGHLPITMALVPEMTASIYTYIISMNMFFGIIAGWLFWKKGIETAMIAHIFAHVGMLLVEHFL